MKMCYYWNGFAGFNPERDDGSTSFFHVGLADVSNGLFDGFFRILT